MWKTLRKTCFFGCLLFTFVCVSLSFSKNANAALGQSNQADVLFYNSYHGQFDATVNLPWSANVGGNANDTVDFFINRVSMLFPIQAQASATNVYGRLVMRFTPAFTSTETAYFCDKKLNDYTSSVDSVSISCPGSVTYYYSDGTSFTSTLPLFFNYSLPSGALNVYADYSQVLPSVALTGIRFTIAKTGNYDVYSVLNGYQLVLTTLVSDGSYFITDPTTGSGTDITPLINQNQVIINQTQEINDFLTDDTPPNVDSSSLSQSAGWLPAGPVDSILTLPISLLQGVVNVFTNPSACQDIILPLPFVNTNLTLPCVGPILTQIGITPLWNVVGAIIGFFLIWNTLKWLYKFVDDTLTMRENGSSLWGGL